ncbi:MAG: membrane protein insertion efficiency factor YidD [Chloroflexi bacterium]|nr:MAG: membrane protein insertion efficiency factor YidD [Chloroflexota bacterium]
MPPLPFSWTTIRVRFAVRSDRAARCEVGPSWFRRVDRLLIPVWVFSLRSYRALISPLFNGSCRFEPSCSHYAEEAVRRHGTVRGFWLMLRRLACCHPFHAGGYDPVPANGSRWKSSVRPRLVVLDGALGQDTERRGQIGGAGVNHQGRVAVTRGA